MTHDRPSLDEMYMNMAYELARRSSCERKKVGCLIVKDRTILAEGYNGTPPGWDNECEDEEGKTKPCVSHAEANAIAKLAKHGISADGGIVYCTLQPCFDCSKQLADCGIQRVVFDEYYRNASAIHYLQERNVEVEKYEESN